MVNRITIYTGGATNAHKLTVGRGGTSPATIQIGGNANVQAVGFDVPPAFSLGSGGLNLIYGLEPAARSTGPELPPSRTVASLSVFNAQGLVLSGGDLTVNGPGTPALALNDGRIVTGSNTFVFETATGTVQRAGGYIIGNYRKRFQSAELQVFEVGTAGGYAPVQVQATVGTFPASLTVTALEGIAPFAKSFFGPLPRSWRLTDQSATLTANLTFVYPAAEVPPATEPANFVFARQIATVSLIPPSAPPTLTTATLNSAPLYSSEWALITNRRPLAGTDAFTTTQGVPFTFPAVRLLDNDFDPDGQTATLLSIANSSPAGASIALSSGQVTYAPPPAFSGADNFSYLVTDLLGGFTIGTVQVTVVRGVPRVTSLAFPGGVPTLQLSGFAGRTYQLEFTDTLTGTWTPLGAPQSVDAQGQLSLNDPSVPPLPPQRFYRVVEM